MAYGSHLQHLDQLEQEIRLFSLRGIPARVVSFPWGARGPIAHQFKVGVF